MSNATIISIRGLNGASSPEPALQLTSSATGNIRVQARLERLPSPSRSYYTAEKSIEVFKRQTTSVRSSGSRVDRDD